MRHIEFLGMPGSGKTTALQLMLRMLRLNGVTVESLEQSALRALLGARGIVASTWLARHLPSRLRPGALRLLSGNASDRSRAFATFGAQHPDFIDYLFERDETRIAPGGRDELLVLLWLLSLVWWFQLATDEASGVDCCVSDHGFSQRGLSLLVYRDAPNTDPWERSVKEYFQCMPQPDVVVVPRAPLEVALARMAKRPQGYPTRVNRLSPSKQRAVSERAERCVELGTEQLLCRGVRVIRLENSGTREDLKRSVEAVAPVVAGIAGA